MTAIAANPQAAAELANAYAQAFVETGQKLSGVSADLANYRSELQIASETLDQTEKALADVRSATGFLFVSGTDPNSIEIQNLPMRQLDLKSQSLAEYRNDLEGIRYLASQIETSRPGADLTQLPWELLGGPVLSERGVLSPALALKSLEDPQTLLATLRSEEVTLANATNQLTKESEDLEAYRSPMNGEFTPLRDTSSARHKISMACLSAKSAKLRSRNVSTLRS